MLARSSSVCRAELQAQKKGGGAACPVCDLQLDNLFCCRFNRVDRYSPLAITAEIEAGR